MDLLRAGSLTLVASALAWATTALARGDATEVANCGSILLGYVALAWAAFRSPARAPLALVACAVAGSVWLALYPVAPLTDPGVLQWLASVLGLLAAAWGVACGVAWLARGGFAVAALVALVPVVQRTSVDGYTLGNWLALVGLVVLAASALGAAPEEATPASAA